MIHPIPAPTSVKAAHGLVHTALDSPATTLGDVRWEQGFGFIPETCQEPESWAYPCVNDPDDDPVTVTENRGSSTALEWTPWGVRIGFKCDTRSLLTVDFEQRARTIMELGESKLIETELWRGDEAGYARDVADANFASPNLTLAQAGVEDITSGAGAIPPTIAIRTLVQRAAGAPGGPIAMIHAKPATATAWEQSGALYRDRNNKLRTLVGDHYVVAGTGYTGEGPGLAAPAANTGWAYITSQIFLLRSEIEALWDPNNLGQYVNREDNDAEAIVQRTAAYYWDGCLHAGLLVDETGV